VQKTQNKQTTNRPESGLGRSAIRADGAQPPLLGDSGGGGSWLKCDKKWSKF